jgi:RNA polymerase sigma factor (sigma-70 family)
LNSLTKYSIADSENKVSFAALIHMRQDTLTLTKAIEQVNAIKANDDSTLKALYHDNYRKVESYVLTNNGSTDEAKDIYQEAFIAVWRNIQLDKFIPAGESSLAGYLYQVAKNKWLDFLRSNHHTKVIPIEFSEVNTRPEEPLTDEENEYVNMVKSNLQKLGEDCRKVLTRFYYHKQTLKVIADEFNWTEATARNNKYRCLQRLRELVNKK